MSVPGGKLRVRAGHCEIKTLQQARSALSHLIRAAESEPDQARVEVSRVGKGPTDKSLKVRVRARWPGAHQLDGFDSGPQWRDHVLTLPQSLIEEVGAGRLTAPVWIISKKLEEIHRYKPYLEANWPCQGIEEMFAPVLEKAAHREVAANALRELIRLEDIGSTRNGTDIKREMR
ncbi:hypothetical protein ACT6QG_14520 [Xanthobacter sp. TB0136]|uniref:hypothetical protein n=1 Tax=Xanthobacter sp. TB0136 TaxID=3459177 RepID=UPI00403A40EA